MNSLLLTILAADRSEVSIVDRIEVVQESDIPVDATSEEALPEAYLILEAPAADIPDAPWANRFY